MDAGKDIFLSRLRLAFITLFLSLSISPQGVCGVEGVRERYVEKWR
jgi:hypothetical protein